MIWLLIGYMVLFIHRPFEVWPELAAIRLERIYMILVLVATAVSGRIQPIPHRINGFLLGFVVAIYTCWLVSPWSSTDSANHIVADWSKIIVFYGLVVCICKTRKDLDLLLLGLCFAVTLYVFHSVVEYNLGRHQYSMGVKRLIGINATYRHPSSFAFIAVSTLPISIFLYRRASDLKLKVFVGASILVSTLGVLLTVSRTGIVGIGIVFLTLLIRSRHRIKILVACVTVVALVWPNLEESKRNRIFSIYDQSVIEEQGGVTSAEARINSLYMGAELFQKYPATGVGPGAWMKATGSPIVSHNLIGTMLGETGLLGTLTFSMLIFSCLYFAIKLRSNARNSEVLSDEDAQFYSDLGATMVVVFVLLLVMGMAGQSLYSYYWIWNAAFIVVAYNAQTEQEVQGWEDDFVEMDSELEESLEHEKSQ